MTSEYPGKPLTIALGAWGVLATPTQRRHYTAPGGWRPQHGTKLNKLSKKRKLRKSRRLTANRSRARNR